MYAIRSYERTGVAFFGWNEVVGMSVFENGVYLECLTKGL